tara:strand:+ start:957 stop:1208 length:252 start_codon:yes stop_codon:yes gene_type:complete
MKSQSRILSVLNQLDLKICDGTPQRQGNINEICIIQARESVQNYSVAQSQQQIKANYYGIKCTNLSEFGIGQVQQAVYAMQTA